MKNLFVMLALTVGALGAGVSSAHAEIYTLTATLTGSEETPAPGLNTGAFGTATVTLDTTARTLSYRVDVFNMPSGVTASHIHVGGVGTTGPVIINFAPPVNASNDFAYAGTVPEAQWVLRLDQGIRSGEDIIQALLGNNTYVNVHSTVNAAGEVRGRLVRKQD